MFIGVVTSALQRYGAPLRAAFDCSQIYPLPVHKPYAVGNAFAPLHANLNGARSAATSGCRWSGQASAPLFAADLTAGASLPQSAHKLVVLASLLFFQYRRRDWRKDRPL